ncbi:hypothetical protein AAVH_29120 [Aphelenchoides avenae]|nr:hypothetical protein AAVH_29120 [Aphelenchus avenae]
MNVESGLVRRRAKRQFGFGSCCGIIPASPICCPFIPPPILPIAPPICCPILPPPIPVVSCCSCCMPLCMPFCIRSGCGFGGGLGLGGFGGGFGGFGGLGGLGGLFGGGGCGGGFGGFPFKSRARAVAAKKTARLR